MTLDNYLEDVKLDLFHRMKTDATLKKEILAYYELNKDNLAFKMSIPPFGRQYFSNCPM